jgi:copper oxidase (laccase) domain-containing protein
VAGIAVEQLAEEFGCRPRSLVAAIGPCIGPEVYEVGESVRTAFAAAGHDADAMDRWFPRSGG